MNALRGKDELTITRMDQEAIDDGIGPCMKACSEIERRFVVAILMSGDVNFAGAARIAGYSASSPQVLSAMAHQVSHRPRVQAAIQEEAKRRLGAAPLIAVRNLLSIMSDPTHPKQLNAIGMILNRTGLHEQTEHKVVVEHKDRKTLLSEIKSMAIECGIDPVKLLGHVQAEAPVDAEFTEVGDASITEESILDIIPETSNEGLEDLL
jgi:hypothetical protein